ncbi:hypothetical protein BJ508DRAFT_338813 [Ascobolus immersus RN42]|uniref:Uncharacterized protein n=1 Tax=Ascobolus immersus RN42 TaxID=1160509 RepID=A0A3N4HNP6_ASCIM|nr:hypothetical protein BJ508DRAFT_338813 [Ascobolus immersus RN42]
MFRAHRRRLGVPGRGRSQGHRGHGLTVRAPGSGRGRGRGYRWGSRYPTIPPHSPPEIQDVIGHLHPDQTVQQPESPVPDHLPPPPRPAIAHLAQAGAASNRPEPSTPPSPLDDSALLPPAPLESAFIEHPYESQMETTLPDSKSVDKADSGPNLKPEANYSRPRGASPFKAGCGSFKLGAKQDEEPNLCLQWFDK